MRVEHVRTESGVYKIHIDGEDPAKPFAVFFHGGPGFNCYGERQVLGGRFRSKVNLLWFDLLGCGEFQPSSANAFSWDGQIWDIVRVIRHFTPDPVHLVAHCSGAEVTHDLVRQHQGLAASVVLYSPVRSLAEALRGVLRRTLEEGRLDPRTLTQETLAAIDRFLSVPEDVLDARDAALMLEMAGAARDFFELYWIDRTVMARWSGWLSECPFSPTAFLDLAGQSFRRGVLEPPDYAGVPIHILHSDNDPITPWERHGRRLRDRIPHATSAVIPGAGHWIQFEKPEECVRETLAFLAGN